MASEAGGEEVRGIGARLRAAREKRGLTILQAAERLHVDARVLEALEAQDFAALGADVYVRGHLRRYADSVGESADELLARYAAGTRAAQPDLTRIPRGAPTGDSAPLMLPALLLVVGCALAGLVWWVLSLPGEKAQPLLAAPSSAAAAAEPSTAGDAALLTETPQQAGVPEPAATQSAPPPQQANAPAAAAGQARLALKFSAPSWIQVSDAGGRRLLEGLIDAGSSRTLTGEAPLHVILGNARAVALEVNGRAVEIAGLVHRDGSARLLIDDTGHASVAPRRLAHGD